MSAAISWTPSRNTRISRSLSSLRERGEPLKAAPPPAAEVTPALIEAAKKRASSRSSRRAHSRDLVICLSLQAQFHATACDISTDGQITQNLSSPSRKNILLSFSPKSLA
jgi:hypothetical protein